ncbi:MAG: Flp pilus assembly complex ATPase component TadA [Propionibacteriaceae bacterium]|nr:Flp pilus assembly complex ATPase component TadA [Propionibacteriaceae bacterium]
MITLADALVQRGFLSQATLQPVLDQHPADLRAELLDRKLVTERQLAEALALQTGREFFDLSANPPSQAVLGLVPAALCRKYRLIPVGVRSTADSSTGVRGKAPSLLDLMRDSGLSVRDVQGYLKGSSESVARVHQVTAESWSARRPGSGAAEQHQTVLVLGMADPTDIVAIDEVTSLTELAIEPVVVSRSSLRHAFERYLRSDAELSEISSVLEVDAAAQSLATTDEDDPAQRAPVVRFVNLLIAQAIDDRASDIHIEPGEHDLIVRFRIDGVMKEVQRADRGIQDGIISRLKIMAVIDIAERRRPQDGRISFVHHDRTVDLRVATLPTVWGEKVVMRILDNAASMVTMRTLAMTPENERRFLNAIARPHGMVLVTGPTGSGKSTTLHAALGEISNPKINVITIEDPVEFRIPGISQVQVNHRTGVTFASSLRAVLRCDPDVVLVGEIRDKETAITSIEAALTGHLVLSTLHTNDAPSALIRLIEIGTEPYLVASALSIVVAQRLARKLCTRCRQPIPISADVMEQLEFPYDPGYPPQLYSAGGCANCANTGYRGRVALHEVMEITPEIARVVVRNGTLAEVREIAAAQGMRPLRQDGWEKVSQGLTTIEEVLRVSG